MDGFDERDDVVVIGATTRHNAVDSALRRPGRFAREIEIGVPDEHEREGILRIHTREMPLATEVHPKQLATKTQGFVGADIDIEDEELSPSLIERIVVTQDDFDSVLPRLEPSALREVDVQLPDATWDQIGGLDPVKQELREGVVWRHPHGPRHVWAEGVG